MEEMFTKVLYELLVEKDLTLLESLKIMSGAGNKKNNLENKTSLEKIGLYILEEIMKGSSLSNSLKRCIFVHFDSIYITFIKFSEITGQLKETIIFLKNRGDRLKENKLKIIEACIYPLLVISLTIAGCLYLQFNDFFKIEKEIFIYLGVLIFLSGILFFCIYRFIGENRLYEAFLGIGFLIKGGINLYDAVGCGAQIVGVTSKYGEKFHLARERLLLGINLEKSFCLGRKFSNAFYFAEMGGGKVDVFEKLAKWIGERDENRRAICLSLIEPVFILITGAFLMIIVSFIFLPYISKMSFL